MRHPTGGWNSDIRLTTSALRRVLPGCLMRGGEWITSPPREFADGEICRRGTMAGVTVIVPEVESQTYLFQQNESLRCHEGPRLQAIEVHTGW